MIELLSLSPEKVRIKKLSEKAIIPTRGSADSAGFDLYAILDEEYNGRAEIAPHSTIKVGTGIAMEIPRGYFGALYARSGLATRRGLRPSTGTSVIDSDYRGEIIVALHNDTDEVQYVQPNERIAQLVIQPVLMVELVEAEELSETERGTGGFGSTGAK